MTLRQLNLPAGDYAIFGSGPLIIRGIIESGNDLDVICRGVAWEQAQTIGQLYYDEEYGVDIVEMHDGRLTFGTQWGIGKFDIDSLIGGAEIIEELPFVKLQHVVTYKNIRGSDKDRRHLQLLAEYLLQTNE